MTPPQATLESHINFPCIAVQQGPVTIYIGALKFSDLKRICTVTPRVPRKDDPLYSDNLQIEAQTPQRKPNEDRLDGIADYVLERLVPKSLEPKEVIFPGSVILGLLANVEEWPDIPEEPTPTSALIIKRGSGLEPQLLLPKLENSIFIIDGQHRLKGLVHLEDRLKNIVGQPELGIGQTPDEDLNQKRLQMLRNLKIPITLLVDFDLAEQAMVFATVNFNQKTVPRSLYFDIFGAFESDRVTTISFTHELVLHLNNSDKSPLKGMIKLLGTGPGLVSQAFLGQRLSLLIDPALPKAAFKSFFLRRQKGDREASRQMGTIIRSFFAAVRKELFYAWPVPKDDGTYSAYSYNFILCKSMAMSGLIAVLGDIYRLSLLDFALGFEHEVAASEIFHQSFFSSFLANFDLNGRKDPAKSDFARGQPWSNGGSAVIEKKIYDTMRVWIAQAYIEQLKKNDSVYRLAIERFNGLKRAAIIAEQKSNNISEFWTAVDDRWNEVTRLF